MTEIELLEKVADISAEYEKHLKETGENFNIFQITTVDYHEVLMCKVISEIINPKGRHGQNDKYLKLFFEKVLELEYSEKYSRARVVPEYKIDNERRIDIVVIAENIFIPIEVKIYAGEQKNQCFDYLKEAEKHGCEYLYYLTLFGNAPSEYSYCEEAALERIKCISFYEHILNWLEECIENTYQQNIKVVLKQLEGAIRVKTDNYEDEMHRSISEVIASSPESFRSALKISRALNNIKTEKLKEVFSSIEERLIGGGYFSKDEVIFNILIFII